MNALTRALAQLGSAAARHRRASIRRHARVYRRRQHLRRLIWLPRDMMELPEPELTLAVIDRLKRALRLSLVQRARRHWSYSRHRHNALLAALGGELTRLHRHYSVSGSD